MVLDFYKLREQPFGVTPDPHFLFLGASHREALASLFCGIEADRGFMALIAHPGMGKTTLTFQLLEKLQQSARTVFFFQTQCNSYEFFRYVLNDLEIDSTGMDIISMHNKLIEVLCQEKQRGRRFIMAIDEAQNLDPAVLETIRLLSNFETPRSKLLQILLIGQPQLATKLADPALLQLKQRISLFARLGAFSAEDVSHYIAHRLKIAGYSGEPLFTAEAIRLIAERSQGIPRNINSLCFSALSLGCATRRDQIDAETIQEVLTDLDVESLNEPAMETSGANSVMFTGSRPPSRENSKRWLGRIKLAAFSLAALIAIAVVLASSLFGRMPRTWPRKSGPSGIASTLPPPSAVAANPGLGPQDSSSTQKIDASTSLPLPASVSAGALKSH